MAKTDVILIKNVVGLGGESDQVKVAAGYARNFLIPQGFAVPLSAANKRRIEVLKQRRAERESHELQAMSELAKSVTKLICVVTVKTGEDGKMFGSVTPGQIADELKRQFEIVLEKRKIHIEKPIRALGEHEVDLRLHHDVRAALKVRVESSTPVAAPVEAAPAADKGGDRKTEKTAKPALRVLRSLKRARKQILVVSRRRTPTSAFFFCYVGPFGTVAVTPE